MRKKGYFQTADDVILCYILGNVITGYMKARPLEAKGWKRDRDLLVDYVTIEYLTLPKKLHKAFTSQIKGAHSVLAKQWLSESPEYFKVFAILVRVSEILEDALLLPDGVKNVFNNVRLSVLERLRIVDINGNLLTDEERERLADVGDGRQVDSANKQAPKVIKLLQKKGFFKHVEIKNT